MNSLHKVLFLLLLPASSFSQISITVSVDKNPVAVGEKFELIFKVENASVENLQVPPLADFEIISGPNKSSTLQYINSVKTESGSICYFLKAKAQGNFTIGPASLSYKTKSYFSEELSIAVVVHAEKQVENEKAPPSAISLFDSFFSSHDSLYFKDGKTLGGKADMVESCNEELMKRKMQVNGQEVCRCIYETIARYYTYYEFTASVKNKGVDIFDKAMKPSSPAYTDMMNCVLSNLSADQSIKKSSVSDSMLRTHDNGIESEKDIMETFFIQSCVSEAKKTKEYKRSGIDANVYCKCAWDNIKAKGIPLDKLTEITDQNSPLFIEVLSPCLLTAMGKNDNTRTETTIRNKEDILGANASERVSLTNVLGTYKVRVNVGGIDKYFTLDSGASEVFINSELERDLLLEGKIKRIDYITSKTFRMANGEQMNCRRLILHDFQIGGYTVRNVTVAISDKPGALLLLGKSLLDKFSNWSIDNTSSELVLTK